MQRVQATLVITTYNRAAMLAAALSSVAESEVGDHDKVEVIVVDNNSTDTTRQTVSDIQRRGFPFALRYILERRQGLSYARNRGTEEAQGTYIAFMDDDQRIDKRYLAQLGRAFADTHAVCVGGPIFIYDRPVLPDWLPPLLQGVNECNYGNETRILGPADEHLLGGNIAFDRAELLNTGGFNVNFGRSGDSRLAGEEDELQMRLHDANKIVAYHPGIIQYNYLDPVRLTKRYWRRHMFDHGRAMFRMRSTADTADREPSLFRAPRWMWRNLIAREIPRALRPLLHLDLTQGFYKQLDVWAFLGQIHEARETHRANPNA